MARHRRRSAQRFSSVCAARRGRRRTFYERAALHRAKDSRRKRRRLDDAGEVRCIVAETPAKAERILAAMMAFKARRYIERDGVDGFDRPGYRSYFPSMTAQHHATGLVHLSAPEVGGEILAAHWGMVAQERFYCLMLGHQSDGLGKYSPGRLLVENLIRWSFDHGLQFFDLGAGNAPWKRLLGAKPAPLLHHEAAYTPLGFLYLGAKRLRAMKAAHD